MKRRSDSMLWRLYRVRRLGALALCFPPLLLCVFYAWRGYGRLDTYRRETEQHPPLTAHMFQLALFDVLRVDFRRMSMDPPPEPSKLQVFAFHIERHDWEALEKSGEIEDERPYLPAKLERDGKPQKVEVRLRGGRYWHTDLPQKSLKVKLDKGDLYEGHRVFNLINDPTPMVVGEPLILELAAKLGALTPMSGFARVRINEKDLGVYQFETQPDESLLRTNHRIPGGVYSGDLPDSAKTKELWSGVERWKKVSSRDNSLEEEANMDELARFLDKISNATHREFAAFAERELDLEAFTAVDVLDVAFGGDQHDYRSNHKYYFDPYKARWEPIAWNFRGFRSDPRFNLVENPLLIRLLMTPEYLTLRDRKLYEFLMADGSPAAVRELGTKLFLEVAPELRTDPFWDAYRLLPRVDGFYRRMVRPMDLDMAALVFDAELTTYTARHAQLVQALESNPLFVALGTPVARAATPTSTAPEGTNEADSSAFETPISLVVEGRGGAQLQAVRVDFNETCTSPRFVLLRGEHVLASADGAQGTFETELPVRPGVGLFELADGNARRGKVETRLVPSNYEFKLRSACPPRLVEFQGTHLATAARVKSRTASPEQLASVVKQWPSPNDVPKLEPGQMGAHPETLEAEPASTVEFGPGAVVISATRVLPRQTHVVIHPGTSIHLGAGVSLVFHGRVDFRGTARAPITISGGDEPFGGLVLQGPGTRGSRFEHVQVTGGSVATSSFVRYPAMVNIHDTEDVSLANCTFAENVGEGDGVHVAYVKGFSVRDSHFANTMGDGLDLEFVTADISRVDFVNMGDDALDLMGTELALVDSTILGAGGNGVSAGEESRVTIRSSLIGDAAVGVLAKNASDVWLTGSVLFRNATGVRVYTREVRYAGASHVNASLLYVIDSTKEAIKRQDRDRDHLDQGRVLESFPQEGNVNHLRDNVLGLPAWSELPSWVDARKREVVL